MHKAQIVSPVLDIQLKQRTYKKHVDAIATMKPTIDTSKPPTVPRLEVYKKRVTRDRIIQLQIENENIRNIKSANRQRSKSRKSAKNDISLSENDFIEDWEDQLNDVDIELGSKNSNGRPTPLLSDPSRAHSVKNVIKDDGMEVVDEDVIPKPIVVKPFDSSRKKSSKSRSGLRRLNPLKKPMKQNRHNDEEEDYNDNDFDDDDIIDDGNENEIAYKNDCNDEADSGSSRSLSGDENYNDNLMTDLNSIKKAKESDDDNFDKYEKASESVDRNFMKSDELFYDNFENFDSTNSENERESATLSKSGKEDFLFLSQNDHSSDKESDKKTSTNNIDKDEDGFDNIQSSDKDENENNVNSDTNKSDHNIDDDLNMDSIPDF